MAGELIFDVTDAPPSRFSIVRGISSLGGIYVYALGGLFTVLPVAIPLVLAGDEIKKAGGDDFWYFVGTMAAAILGPAAGLALLYWRNARHGRRALRRIRIFGLTLREVRKSLAKRRAGSGWFRGAALLLNLMLAIATPVVAARGFDAFNEAAYGPGPALAITLLTGAFVLNGLRLWGDRGSFIRTVVLMAGIIAAWIGWIFLVGNVFTERPESANGFVAFAQFAGFLVSGIILMTLTGSLWARARGSMEEMLRRDKRPLTLYLRSFDDEDTDGGSPAEQALKNALRAYGPFVAISRPGDLQPDAAARTKVADSKWQGVVLDLMQRAGAIIVTPGMTAGLDWEIRQISERNYLDKAVFVFPPRVDALQRFVRLIGLLGDRPEARSLEQVRAKGILAVSHTQPAGWMAVTAEYATEGVYEAAVDAAFYSMSIAKK